MEHLAPMNLFLLESKIIPPSPPIDFSSDFGYIFSLCCGRSVPSTRKRERKCCGKKPIPLHLQ
jgi:hypothetical protein